MIEFDAASHTYTVGGRRLPSVTEVLRPLYGDLRFVQQDILDYKSELGVAVHKAVELHVLGGLDYGSLVSPVADYFDQYLAFEAETGFEAAAAEVRVHSVMGYAGTLDLEGVLSRKASLIDLKTTAALSPAVALQTAAYQHARNECLPALPKMERRFALRLMPDKYRLVPFTDASDFAVFLSLLKLNAWCQSAGKTYEVQP